VSASRDVAEVLLRGIAGGKSSVHFFSLLVLGTVFFPVPYLILLGGEILMEAELYTHDSHCGARGGKRSYYVHGVIEDAKDT